MRTLKEIGEFSLIKKIYSRFKNMKGHGVCHGIGDDAAVVMWKKKKSLILTTDTLVEGIHFDCRWDTWQDIGYKALALSLSDLAAMGGGEPKWVLLNLALPVDKLEKDVDNFFRGVTYIAREYKVRIIGGDTVSSPKNSVITLTLAGEISSKQVILRSGARVGDKILVTGPFGDSAAGLDILKRGIRDQLFDAEKLIRKHLRPEPRIKEAGIISRRKLATAMIDSSDGLDYSLKFICQESKKGARINVEAIPLSSTLCRYSLLVDAPALSFALYGGEDLELVFTVSSRKAKEVLKALPRTRVIGEIIDTPRRVIYQNRNGKRVTIAGHGYEHFKDSKLQEFYIKG